MNHIRRRVAGIPVPLATRLPQDGPGRTAGSGGRKRTNTAIRMRPKLAAGVAAAVLALTANAGAAASPGGTDAVSVAARHALTDNRFTELLALNQVKWAVAWAAVQRAWAGQPRTATSRLTDQRALGQVKRQASWKAVHRATGR